MKTANRTRAVEGADDDDDGRWWIPGSGSQRGPGRRAGSLDGDIVIATQQLRAKCGITQLQLAQRARVAQGYLSSLEAGRQRNPGIETLRKLAKALGVPVTRLLA
jgi:DNA-binding XRE family transcriptional regulator